MLLDDRCATIVCEVNAGMDSHINATVSFDGYQRDKIISHMNILMENYLMNKSLSDPRFAGIEPFKSKVWLF